MKKYLFIFLWFMTFFIGGYAYTHSHYSPIPKIIHYVWLGKNPLPDSAKKIIKSWQTQAPDYKIIRWDETNCDVDANHYIKWAYKSGLWAFASDWCRLNALYKYGGLYLDTDHELTKNPTPLFRRTNLVMTYEKANALSGSFIATAKGHPFIKSLIEYYKNLGPNRTGIPTHLTQLYHNRYTHTLNGLAYHSKDVSLLPSNIAMLDLKGGENVAIHHYKGTNSFKEEGFYYPYFINQFLDEMAVPVCLDDTKHSLIMIDGKSGYFLKMPQEKITILNQTDTALSIKKASQIHHLHFKDNCYRK